MKKIYLFACVVLATFGTQAQDSASVIFAIDMNDVTNISTDGVTLAGNVQDNMSGGCTEWTPGCSFMTDDDGDGVYTLRVMVLKGTYEYKYVNGTAWGNNEGPGLSTECGVDDNNGAFNRTLDLTNAPAGKDTIIGPFKYDSCAVSSIQVTSVERALDQQLGMKVTPNPASEAALLSFINERGQTFRMTMTTMTGAIVRSETATGSSIAIPRNDLPAGLYFVTMTNADGQRATRKLIFR